MFSDNLHCVIGSFGGCIVSIKNLSFCTPARLWWSVLNLDIISVRKLWKQLSYRKICKESTTDYTEGVHIRSRAGVETKRRDDNSFPHHAQYETKYFILPSNHLWGWTMTEQVSKTVKPLHLLSFSRPQPFKPHCLSTLCIFPNSITHLMALFLFF